MTRHIIAAACVAILAAGCGDSKPPTQPPPVVNPPTNNDPPANTRPAIDSISVQGRRQKQPPRFADVREVVDVSATVRDPETPVEELTYQWTATHGTFNGTGRTVTWTAPDTIDKPMIVTITLKVIENFGHPGQAKIFAHDATSTVTVALHDSVKEVGDMSGRFLTEFSKPQTNTDWRDVMRDFNRTVCPNPSEYDDERRSVEDHIANYSVNAYNVGTPAVTVGFGGMCGDQPGDACASVRVMWDSTGPLGRSTTRGTDSLSAVYSAIDQRWWLCSSKYAADSSFYHPFYSRK